MDNNTTTIDLPDTECALTTSGRMEDLHFTFPNPEHQVQNSGSVSVPPLMAYLAACYYRFNRDPAFTRQMLDWARDHLEATLGHDIEDKLASSSLDNGDKNGNGNGYSVRQH
jgi:hypothetical protein